MKKSKNMLGEIRAKLSSNWATLDSNNDGKIDSSELMAQYDGNQDGKLDTIELNHLADQLTHQLEYSNSLLLELQQAESTQLDLQKQLSEKSDLLRAALNAADELKNEGVELRRKWKISQEISDNMTKQSKSYRLELQSQKEELNRVTKEYSESKALLEDVMEERSRLQRSLTQSQMELSSTKEDAERAFGGFEVSNNKLTEENESLKNEIGILRGRLGPLISERQSMKDHMKELVHTLEETSTRCEEETNQRQIIERRARELDTGSDQLRDQFSHLKVQLDELTLKNANLNDKVRELELVKEELEGRCQETEGTSVGLAHQIQKQSHVEEALHKDLDELSSELEEERVQRKADRDRYESGLASVLADCDARVEEANERSKEGIQDAARTASHESDERRRLESKFNKANEEIQNLTDMLKNAQIEASDKTSRFVEEREQYEGNIRNATLEINQLQDRISHLNQEMLQERESYQVDIKALRKEMLNRGNKFVEVLQAFKMASGALREEASDVRESLKGVLSEIVVLRNATTRVVELSNLPRATENELGTAFSRIFAKLFSTQEKLKDARDDISRESIMKEEHKSRLLMLQESLSRTEHDLALSRQANSQDSSKTRLRLEELSTQLESERKMRKEMENRLSVAQKSAESANATARQLQMRNATMVEELDMATSKHSSSKQEMDGKAIELATTLKKVLQEKELLEGQKLEETRRVESLMEELNEKDALIEGARTDLVSRSREVEMLRHSQKSSLGNASNNQLKYQEQLQKTQELIKTLQSQKNELFAQNQALSDELRGYQQTLTASTSIGEED